MTLIKVFPPELIRATIQGYSHQNEPAEFPDRRKGPIIGEVDKALAHRGDDKDFLRRLVFGWLTCSDNETIAPTSSKLLTPQQWNALWLWIGSEQHEDENWYPRSAFPVECNWICTRAMYDYNLFLEASKRGKGMYMTMHYLLNNIPDLSDVPDHAIEIDPDDIIEQTLRSMPGTLPIGDSLRGITTAADASNAVMHRLMQKDGSEDYVPDAQDIEDETENTAEPIIIEKTEENNEENNDEPEFGY